MRILISLLISILVGRWIYAEVGLLVPEIPPTIETLLQKIDLPTHADVLQGKLFQYSFELRVVREDSADAPLLRLVRAEEGSARPLPVRRCPPTPLIQQAAYSPDQGYVRF